MTGPWRTTGDQGQITPMIAILTTALLVLAGLAIDGGRLLATRRAANAVAAGAARAGAQAMDTAALRTGTSRLDHNRAAQNAHAYLTASGATGTVQVTDSHVTVEVTLRSRPVLLSIIGIGERSVTGTGTARIVRGL